MHYKWLGEKLLVKLKVKSEVRSDKRLNVSDQIISTLLKTTYEETLHYEECFSYKLTLTSV